MNEHAKVDQVPAIGISFQHKLDQGDFRSVVFQTHLAADCGEIELNRVLDKLLKASERQRALANLPTNYVQRDLKRAKFKQESEKLLGLEAEASVNATRWAQANAESGRRGPLKMSSQQKNEETNLNGRIDSSRKDLKQLLEEIELYDRLIGDMEALVAAGGEADASDREPTGS